MEFANLHASISYNAKDLVPKNDVFVEGQVRIPSHTLEADRLCPGTRSSLQTMRSYGEYGTNIQEASLTSKRIS